MKVKWEMRFFYPSFVIHDTLAFKTTYLQRDIWYMLHQHVRSSSNSSYIFEVFSH